MTCVGCSVKNRWRLMPPLLRSEPPRMGVEVCHCSSQRVMMTGEGNVFASASAFSSGRVGVLAKHRPMLDREATGAQGAMLTHNQRRNSCFCLTRMVVSSCTFHEARPSISYCGLDNFVPHVQAHRSCLSKGGRSAWPQPIQHVFEILGCQMSCQWT